MIRIFSFLVAFLLLHYFPFAQQPCNDDAIMNKKGSWKKVSDANTFPDQSFPKNQFSLANNRIDKMQKMLQAAYPDPKGIEAEWYRGISGNALVKGGPVPYELEALFLAYFCNTYEKKSNLEMKPTPGSMYGPINLTGLLNTLRSIRFINYPSTC